MRRRLLAGAQPTFEQKNGRKEEQDQQEFTGTTAF